MKPQRNCDRRQFIKTSAGAGLALAAPWIVPGNVLGNSDRPPPSDRITMACIGLGGKGTGDFRAFLGSPRVQVVALCDVDKGSRNYARGNHLGLEPALRTTEDRYAQEKRSGIYRGCSVTQDFREIIARDDIDAVCIATPDHWHAPMVMAAAEARMDIFCQKPLSVTIAEGRRAVEAVKRQGRVFQCGTQRRSNAQCRHSCELVRNGRVGRIHTVRVGLPPGHMRVRPVGSTDPMPIPDSLNYDLWLGPAPWAPYTLERCHFTFRWIYDYSGGYVTDWGAHYCDMAQWGMGTDDTGPVEIEGTATFPAKEALWDTATDYSIRCRYREGFDLLIESKQPYGVLFQGEEGSVDLEGDTVPAFLRSDKIWPNEMHLYESKSQYENFLDCVKTRQLTSAPAEVAHRSVSVCHLANAAIRLGRKVFWDPKKELFLDDAEANRFLSRATRESWKA